MRTDCPEETVNPGLQLPYEDIKECYIETLGQLARKPVYEFVKRGFDIVVSLVALLVLAVPMCLVAIAVKCGSHGPALYAQDRLGKDAKPFRVIKFRTMVADAEKGGAQWCKKEDARITPVGRFLRRFHIDELPQLWNILVGDMSFVGPRPEREIYYDAFEEYIHGFRERLKVKPGLTGLAQIVGGSYMRPEEKILCDVRYIKERSFLFDLKILIQTAVAVLTGRHNLS